MSGGTGSIDHGLVSLFVFLTAHEGRRAVSHKNFRELSIAFVHDAGKDLVELRHVGLDQLKLVVALPESRNLDFQVNQRLLRILVSDVFPELLFQLSVGKALVAVLLDGLGSVRFVRLETLESQILFVIKSEVCGRAVALYNGILVLVGHLTAELFSVN